MRAQTVCTVSRAKRIIAGVWIVTSVYCMLWFFLVDIHVSKEGHVECSYKVSRDLYLPIYLIDFTIFYVVPLLLAIVLYGLIARILFLSPIPNRADTATTLCKGDRSQKDKPGTQGGGGKSPNRPRTKGAVSSRKQVTKMLAVVVILFALLWMPYRTLVLVNSFMKEPYLNSWFLLFCRMCIYANSAINPVVYNLMSQKFRSAFRKLCKCQEEENQRRTMCMTPTSYSMVRDTVTASPEANGKKEEKKHGKRGKEVSFQNEQTVVKKDEELYFSVV